MTQRLCHNTNLDQVSSLQISLRDKVHQEELSVYSKPSAESWQVSTSNRNTLKQAFEWHLILTDNQDSQSHSSTVKSHFVCVFCLCCALRHFPFTYFLVFASSNRRSGSRWSCHTMLLAIKWVRLWHFGLFVSTNVTFTGLRALIKQVQLPCFIPLFTTITGDPVEWNDREGRHTRLVEEVEFLRRILPNVETPRMNHFWFVAQTAQCNFFKDASQDLCLTCEYCHRVAAGNCS